LEPQKVRIPCPVTGSAATGKPQRFLDLLPAGRARIAMASLARPSAAQASARQKYAGADISKFARARVDAPHKAYDVAVKLWKQLQTEGCIQRVLASGI
jgi:hypothetical protein